MRRSAGLALAGLTAVAPAAPLTLGCARRPSPPPPTVGATALVTSADRYVLRVTRDLYQGAVPFRFTNRTGRPVAVPVCGWPTPPALERWDGRRRRWVQAYPLAILACIQPPLVIPAGGTHGDTLRIRVFRPGTRGGPRFAVPPECVPGSRYRLRWSVNEAPPAGAPPGAPGTPIPAAERTSNSFEFELLAPGRGAA